MSEVSPIEWTDSTVNPVMGCSGCELWSRTGVVDERCYAAFQHRIRGGVSKGYAPNFGLPTLYPGRMRKAAAWSDLTGTRRPTKPWLDRSPRLIFTSDMSDALSVGDFIEAGELEEYRSAEDRKRYRAPLGRSARTSGVPFEFLETEIVETASSEKGRRHRWQWLTKLPNRAAEFAAWRRRERGTPWPSNLWIGTSLTSNKSLGRIGSLIEVGEEDTVRFLSIEPLFEELDQSRMKAALASGRIGWVIVGGESRQSRSVAVHPLDVAWVRALRDLCADARVPCFIKQLGTEPHDGGRPLRLSDKKGGGAWEEWPADLRVREIPR